MHCKLTVRVSYIFICIISRYPRATVVYNSVRFMNSYVRIISLLNIIYYNDTILCTLGLIFTGELPIDRVLLPNTETFVGTSEDIKETKTRTFLWTNNNNETNVIGGNKICRLHALYVQGTLIVTLI